MASSRLEKYGTIFLRTQGLLRTGAIKQAHKPLWFDVYEQFPPHVEPRALRPVPQKSLLPILYAEDEIRAKFYEKFSSKTVLDLTSTNNDYKALSEKFIEKYIELTTSTEFNEHMFEKVVDTLKAEGISLSFERKPEKAERRKDNLKIKEDLEDLEDIEELLDDEYIHENRNEMNSKPLKFDVKSILSDKSK